MDGAWRALLSPSGGGRDGRQGSALPGRDAPGMHAHPLAYNFKSPFDFQIPNVHSREVSFPFS